MRSTPIRIQIRQTILRFGHLCSVGMIMAAAGSSPGCLRCAPEGLCDQTTNNSAKNPPSTRSSLKQLDPELPALSALELTAINAQYKLYGVPNYQPRHKDFADFQTMVIDSLVRRHGLKLNSFELILLFGPPDGYKIGNNGDVFFQYLLTRKTEGDWESIVTVSKDGVVTAIGWNVSGYNYFHSTTLPSNPSQ